MLLLDLYNQIYGQLPRVGIQQGTFIFGVFRYLGGAL